MDRMYRKVKDDNATPEFQEYKTKLATFLSKTNVEDVDGYYSDLYLKVTPESTAFIKSLPFEYRIGGAFVSTFRSQIDNEMWYEIVFGNPYYDYNKEWTNGSKTDFSQVCMGGAISDSRRIKDDEYGSEMDFGGDDFPSIVEAFKSVYNEENLQEVAYRDLALVDDSYFYKDRYDNIARFDFNHPNAQFTFTSGYTCGSNKIDEIVYDSFNEVYEEVVAEYKKDYPDMQEGDMQDDNAWEEAYYYEQEHTGITYVVMLEEKQDGVHIDFSIGAGYVTATEYGDDLIIERVVNNSDEAMVVAQEILDFIADIHFE